MSTPQQWAEALGKTPEGFTLQFQRLGLEADCRVLTAEEVEECRRMGGEKGLRYALYLSCDALRQAGEQLKRQGELALSFDITQRLAYGDILAAGGAVLSRSGVGGARVALLEEPGTEGRMLKSGTQPETVWQGTETISGEAGQDTLPAEPEPRPLQLRLSGVSDREEQDTVMALARVFAERLATAASNS